MVSSQAVVDFLWEDVICYYNCFKKLIIDKILENKDVVAELIERFRILKIVVSIYHSQANGMIKYGHKTIVNIL